MINIQKVCFQCKIPKDQAQFAKDKSKKDGLSGKCKECVKQWQNLNKLKLNEYDKSYYLNNKNSKLQYLKEYNEVNKEKQKEYRSNNYSNNSDILKLKAKEYRIKNPEKFKYYYQNNKERICLWIKNRYDNDINFRLKYNLRTRIWNALQIQNGIKSKHTIELLGYTIEEYKLYHESLFKPEMNWNNHGTVWEIDHIISCDKFDLTNLEQQKICFNYTNTQPLFKTTQIAESFGYTDQIGNRNKSNK